MGIMNRKQLQELRDSRGVWTQHRTDGRKTLLDNAIAKREVFATITNEDILKRRESK